MNTITEIEQIDDNAYKIIKLLHISLEISIDRNIFWPKTCHVLLPDIRTLTNVSIPAKKIFSQFPNIFYQDIYTNQKDFRKECDEKCLELLELYDLISKTREIAFNEIKKTDCNEKRECLTLAYNALDYPLIYTPSPLESRLCGTGKFTKPAPLN
jgi:hypothetical protein